MPRDGRASLKAIFAVARTPELSAQEVRLWILYRSYEQSDGRGAYPGDELLANHLDKSPRSVQKYRARLLKLGYLEQRLRGPNPARYRAVLPDEASQPSAKQDQKVSPEASCDATEGSQKASQKGSQKASQPTAPEYQEYGEYGEEECGRSSPSGRRPPGGAGGEHSRRNGPGPGAALSREDLLENGLQAVGARFGPPLREHLYTPDGHPPESYSEGRDVEILHALLQRGYRPERLEVALLGVAHERDAGHLDVAAPGQKVTARVLLSGVTGRRDPVGHFEDIGRRVLAGERDVGRLRSSSGGGLSSVGALLDSADSNGGRPVAEEDA